MHNCAHVHSPHSHLHAHTQTHEELMSISPVYKHMNEWKICDLHSGTIMLSVFVLLEDYGLSVGYAGLELTVLSRVSFPSAGFSGRHHHCI